MQHDNTGHDHHEAGGAAPTAEGGRHPRAHKGHDKHEGHSPGMFRRRFLVTLVLAVPVVVFSESVQEWLNYSTPEFAGDGLIAPVLGTVIFAYGGLPFLQGAYREALDLAPGMMTLISLAISAAFGASVASEFTGLDLEFWWELATLIVIMLFGHWQEMRALGQARGALQALAELIPDEAERVADGGTERVRVSELVEGDIVLARPGARVPVDGVIVEGRADLDESVITGETRPVAREEGDRVVAGGVVGGSAIRVRVEAVGEATALAGIRRMIEEAQGSRSRAQALADRAAAALFYVAVAAGLVTLAAWGVVGDEDAAVIRSVTVLVIACPHALGLAIPLVIALSTGLSANAGILVKDRLALERTRLVDTVLFDKTGTLTKGQHAVSGVAAVDGDEDRVLRLAGAVEADSEHPLARAIVTAAKERGDVPEAEDFEAMAGRGVRARMDGRTVRVGGPALLRELEIEPPAELDGPIGSWRERGAAVVYVVEGEAVVGAIALEDEVRPESRAAVATLHQQGIRVAMITGDARQVADAVAKELDIDEVFAEVLPEDKDKVVQRLQHERHTVAMVGDGVNDAPALARADVGIAIGAGTDVAIQSAGVVLASDDPRGVVGIVRLSRASYRKMVQNLVWASGYNVVAIPLAAGVLSPIGFVIPPAAAALLMSLSTVIVALNAQLLRRLDLRPGAAPA
ncbi:MAG: heavy metal translocating P-type ATPase [Dehalococcoidia bacterium]